MSKITLPENYQSLLGLYDTQKAIGLIKTIFQEKICMALHLKRVTAPLFVMQGSGLNDDLNGVERPVSFDVPCLNQEAEVVHSLAKWKRYALYKYGFRPGQGLVTDMNAIRRDEELDNLHSIYVDQWDWEKVIERRDQRTRGLSWSRHCAGHRGRRGARPRTTLCSWPFPRPEHYPRWAGRCTFRHHPGAGGSLDPDYTPKQREDAFCQGARHTVSA